MKQNWKATMVRSSQTAVVGRHHCHHKNTGKANHRRTNVLKETIIVWNRTAIGDTYFQGKPGSRKRWMSHYCRELDLLCQDFQLLKLQSSSS